MPFRFFIFAPFALATQLTASAAHGTPSSDELIRQGQSHEQAGEFDAAMHCYGEAISIATTESAPYLALARVRVRVGDLREADRVYSAALLYDPTRAEAIRERAHVRWNLGRHEEAEWDLRRHIDATGDLVSARALAADYQTDGRYPAALIVWRFILVAADGTLTDEARTMVTALTLLVPSDPVAHPAIGAIGQTNATRWVRESLARVVSGRK